MRTIKSLTSTLGNRVISRGTAFTWPGYLLDLPSVDFRFWRYLESEMSDKNYADIDAQKSGIIHRIVEVS